MNDRIPKSVVTGRKVAMALLVVAMLLTVAAVVWVIVLVAAQPVVG